MIKEIWKPVVYRDIKQGKYEVSNMGRFRNDKGHIMAQCQSEKGYMMSVFMCDGKQRPRTLKVHRIVANAFVPGHDEKHNEVNHKDGDKRNNNVTNLEWVTHEENIHHGYENNLIPVLKGSDNGNSVYSEDLIHIICILLLEFDGANDMVMNQLRKNNIFINKDLITGIKHKHTWRHISDLYFDKCRFIE